MTTTRDTTALLSSATGPTALSREAPRGRPIGEWGVILLITTEAALFACLLASYFYLRFTNGGPWPPAGIEQPALSRPLIMTALLLSSSVPLVVGERSIRQGHTRRLTFAILLTMLLGLAFLTMQGIEYHEKLAEFTWTSNVYGSLFYLITGFHGFHVVTGLIMLGVLTAATLAGRFSAHRHEGVRMVALYWHFVDVVWLAILFSLYLSPHL